MTDKQNCSCRVYKRKIFGLIEDTTVSIKIKALAVQRQRSWTVMIRQHLRFER